MPLDVDATWANSPDDPSSSGFDPSLNPQYDAAELRRADAAGFAGSGAAGLAVRGGIAAHATTSLLASVDGADQVTVKPGAVVIPANAADSAGCYRTALSADYTQQLATRDATNPRVDLVVFRMLDVDVVATHTARRARIEVLTGNPSGSPSPVPLPSMAVELARVNVPASGGGAATVDLSKRTFAAALGGELLVPTQAALPAQAPPWQRARALDTGSVYVWNGTAWAAADAGKANYAIRNADFTVTTAETLVVATAAVPVKAGGVYKVSASLEASHTTANTVATIRLRADTTAAGVTGTLVKESAQPFSSANRVVGATPFGLYLPTATGSAYFKLTAFANAAGGSIKASTYNVVLLVEQIA